MVHREAIAPHLRREGARLYGSRWNHPGVAVVYTNYLLNPAHPDFVRVRVGRPEPFTLDPRMLTR